MKVLLDKDPALRVRIEKKKVERELPIVKGNWVVMGFLFVLPFWENHLNLNLNDAPKLRCLFCEKHIFI